MPNATNTQQLVTLPKDVAAAIEELRQDKRSNFEIIEFAYGGSYGYFAPADILADYVSADESDVSFTNLLSALVKGYQVAKTPAELEAERKENVREYYSEHEDELEAEPDGDSQTYAYCDGLTDGVRKTLDLLRIQIEGVNR